MPIYASLTLAVPWRRRQWRPRAGYNRPVQSKYTPGLFYSLGCTWAEWGPLRLSVVWSNPKVSDPKP